MPERIQRRRTRGWHMPEGAIYVGRPTVWGNPYSITPNAIIPVETVEEAVAEYRKMIEGEIRTMGYIPHYLRELRGHNLACWCRVGSPCHADVLLEIANA